MLNKVIAGALYIVICGWNAVKVLGWQLTVECYVFKFSCITYLRCLSTIRQKQPKIEAKDQKQAGVLGEGAASPQTQPGEHGQVQDFACGILCSL